MPAHAMYSAFTFGIMNNTSGNQATHCYYIRGAAGLRVAVSNRSFAGAFASEFCQKIAESAQGDETLIET
jgi:hypothetical protein